MNVFMKEWLTSCLDFLKVSLILFGLQLLLMEVVHGFFCCPPETDDVTE